MGVLAASVLLSAATIAHARIAGRADESTGILLVLDHLFSLGLVVGLFAIGAGVGARVVKAAAVQMEGPLEALLFWTATGLGVLATTIVTVGLFFGLRPIVLLALLGGAAVLGRNELRQLPKLAGDALYVLRTRADRFSLSIFLLIALFLISRALAPPTDWDALMYHLRVPRQLLEAGFIYRPEDNAHFAFVGLPHMLYLPLLALGSEAGPALLSAFCTLGLALAGFTFGLRWLDDRTASLALAVLWGSPILLLVAVTPRIDTILAFYLFLVHYTVIRAKQRQDARFLYLGATLAGMAVGVKFTALLYLAVLAPLGIWVVVTRLRQRATVLTVVLGLAVVSALPWLLKNILLIGDPLYPFFGGRSLDPWLARIYGGDALPPLLDPAVFDTLWAGQKPFSLVDLFLAPERITIELEGVFYRPNLLLLALPLWLLFRKDEMLGWLAGPALAYVGLVVLLQPTTSLRYLIPAIAPLTLVALHAYARAWDQCFPSKYVRSVLRATTLVVLAQTVLLISLDVTRQPLPAYAIGSVSRNAFLRARARDYADVVSFVNSLPKHSRLLMLFDGRGYYVRVPVLQDNVIMNWPLLSEKVGSLDCLRAAGITHVLVNTGVLDYYARKGVDLSPLRLSSFDTFTRECLSSIYSAGGFTVFRVRTESAREPRDPAG